MNLYNIYKEASRRIAQKEYKFACDALAAADENCKLITTYLFKDYFEPDEHNGFWWTTEVTEENQLARSLALLFMAEFVKEKE